MLTIYLLLPLCASSQEPVPGYEQRVSGEVLHYHSPLPEVEHSLLVRSEDASRSIEWLTAPVPEDLSGDFVEFVWMFGLQADSDRHGFQLHVDGEPWGEFRNPLTTAVRDWTLEGAGGSTLRFRATLVDRFDDLMGYATLRLPRDSVTAGEPVRLSVVGESAGSRSWYMTFQKSLEPVASLVCQPGLLRSAEAPYQVLRLNVMHLGEATPATIRTSFGSEFPVTLEVGGNPFDLPHSAVDEPTEVEVEVVVGERVIHGLSGEVQPVRPWHIDLVQHTHTDVGYTRPQTEILPEHLRYIDTALDYCDRTDSYPDDAKFRWTCEASWAVREYIESRTPEQVARLRRRVTEGRIEVTSMFLNMSEVVDEASYAAFLDPVAALREAGLRVTTAMQNDINGAAWCLADYAADMGIEFLTMGQHGHRALLPFDMPTSFWWESPAGKRILAFRADHYQTGNFWGVHNGSVDAVEENLLYYLRDLRDRGYPFDRVAVQHSGYPTDNSPPSTGASELVQAWNEKYVWPRLRCSVAREFPEYVRDQHADELPVRRVSWPDWWADGFGSAPRESAAARLTQARIQAVESLFALERILGLKLPSPLAHEIDEVRDALLFYGEHTFGAAESISDPFCENSMVQWAEKSAYAWDAVKRTAVLGEGALGRLTACFENDDSPRLIVFNGLNFPRSGLLELYADHQLLPTDRTFRLVDEAGDALAVQLQRSRAEGSYWAIWVRDVPSFGLRSWRVELDEEGEPRARAKPEPGHVLENDFYRLEIDERTGGIASLFDKSLGCELTDTEADWQLGQVVRETLGNREQLEAFMLEDYERELPSDVKLAGVRRGPIWDSLSVQADLPGCQGPGGLSWEIRLYHESPQVELLYTAQKRRVFDPESIYVAFPFSLKQGRVVYETLGGVVEPESQILHGAASDWQTMQNFVAVRSPRGQIILQSDEVPLIQIGAINTGRYQRAMRVDKTHIFSWVMNNYWTTNFVAAPEGELRWSYRIVSDADSSNGFASRSGLAGHTPFLARLLEPGHAEKATSDGSILSIESDSLLLVAARPAKHWDGVVLHLREVEGRPAKLSTRGWRIGEHAARVQLVNVIESVLTEIDGEIEFEPFENGFLLLTPAR